MSWRLLPPVYSPVSPSALLAGLVAQCGCAPARHARVESILAERYDAHAVVLTDSGTSALVLAMRAAVPDGGIVALPAYGCYDLTAAARCANAQVRLYDLDPATLSPDLASVRRVIERGVDAIVVVHLYGYPADIDGVRQLAAARGVPVIEDAAQGGGGMLHGRPLGSIGDLAVLSFGRGKGMTSGSGGALLARTPALAAWTHDARGTLEAGARGGRELVALGAQWLLARPSLYRLPASIPSLRLGEMVYHDARAPRAIAAGAVTILESALRGDAREVNARREHAALLMTRMKSTRALMPVRPIEGAIPGYLRCAALAAADSIQPNPALGVLRGYPLTLSQHAPITPILAPGENAAPGAAELRDRLFTFPTHGRMRIADVERIGVWCSALSHQEAGDANARAVDHRRSHAVV